MDAKGYFYHVTDNSNWANEIRLKPRITSRCDQNEPEVFRICVCPTVVGCFMAACYTEGYHRVYRTKRKVSSVKPYDVYDAEVTGERWLLEPTDFVLIHDFGEEDIKNFPCSFDPSCKNVLNSQIAAKKRFEKYFAKIANSLPRAKWI
jgi:hypothetical protein